MESYPVTSSLITYWCLVGDIAQAPLEGEVGLNLSQYRVMKFVSDAAEGASLSAIADNLVLSRGQVGKIVALLEGESFLVRGSSFSGSYASAVKITARGRSVLARCDALVAAAVMHFMLPAKPLFDDVTLRSRTWIAAGLDASKLTPSTTFGRGLDIGDVIRLGMEGAAKVEDLLSRRCRQVGLSKLDYRVLLDLCERVDGVLLTELANGLLAKQSNIAVSVKHLNALKMVTRRVDSRDGRKALARITPKGRAACDAVTEPLNELLMSMSGSDTREIRDVYVEISRICVDAERKRRGLG